MKALSLATALSILVVPLTVFAAGTPPPAEVDLGAMKLKRANAPAATPVATPTVTALPAIQRSPVVPGGAATAPAAAAANPATASPAAPTGIGNVVQAPTKARASDILSSSSKPEEKAQQSNDVQVKMPSLFKRP